MPKFARYDKNSDISYACGVFPALELMTRMPEAVKALLLSDGGESNSGVRKLMEICAQRGVYTEIAPKAIERICGKENCMAVAVFSKYMSKMAEDRPHVVLHQVSDAGNFGTILRTCLGFGFRDVAVIKPCVDIFSPQSVRASMGAVFGLNVGAFGNFEEYSKEYPRHSRFYFRLQNARNIYEIDEASLKGTPVLVFGNEASGLPEELRREETGVFIPQSAEIDSLNLSVAAGIGIAHFSRLFQMGL